MKHTHMVYEGVVSPEICNSIIKQFKEEDFVLEGLAEMERKGR